ncbi:MAG: PEP-CTERM sorting domain-containing protein [Planctomycetota bacterium]
MRHSREKASVNNKRWAAYAAAGAAAALGSHSAAEADIFLSEPNVQLLDSAPGDGYFGLAYAASFGNPAAQLVFLHAYSETGAGQGILTLQGSLSSAAPGSFAVSFVGATAGPYAYPSNLAYGQNISTLGFVSAGNRGDMAWGGGYSQSQWVDTDGYFAFRFDVGNGTQYGWGQLTLDSGAPANIFTLNAIAFADPGQSLFVGETMIPEPGSLGLLAMGAAGLVAWRRRRAQAA